MAGTIKKVAVQVKPTGTIKSGPVQGQTLSQKCDQWLRSNGYNFKIADLVKISQDFAKSGKEINLKAYPVDVFKLSYECRALLAVFDPLWLRKDLSHEEARAFVNLKWDLRFNPADKDTILQTLGTMVLSAATGNIYGAVAAVPLAYLRESAADKKQQAAAEQEKVSLMQSLGKEATEVIRAGKTDAIFAPETEVKEESKNLLASGPLMDFKNPYVITGFILLVVLIIYYKFKK